MKKVAKVEPKPKAVRIILHAEVSPTGLVSVVGTDVRQARPQARELRAELARIEAARKEAGRG